MSTSEQVNRDDSYDWIPCEICDTLVRFTDYNNHIDYCFEQSIRQVPRRIESEDEDDDESEDEEAYNEQENSTNIGNVFDEIFLPLLPSLEQTPIRFESNFAINVPLNSLSGILTSGNDNNDEEGENELQSTQPEQTPLDVPSILSNFLESRRRLRSLDIPRVSITTRRNGTSLSSLLNQLNITPLNEYDFNLSLADLIGKVERGIDDIEKVSQVVDINDRTDTQDCICSICQETFRDIATMVPKVNIRKMLCEHLYCEPCITTWLKNHVTCPVCSQELDTL